MCRALSCAVHHVDTTHVRCTVDMHILVVNTGQNVCDEWVSVCVCFQG